MLAYRNELFYAILEFTQSQDCVTQSLDPEIACQSWEHCKFVNLNMQSRDRVEHVGILESAYVSWIYQG